MNQHKLFLAVLLLLIPAVAQAQPLRVFILAGQSNMQGHAQVRTGVHVWHHHGKMGGWTHPLDQNVVGRQELEHRFSATERRTTISARQWPLPRSFLSSKETLLPS